MSNSTLKCLSRFAVVAIFLITSLASPGLGASAEDTGDWLHWRGPLGIGVVPEGNPPVAWSEEKNVIWKTPLPGLGTSTPVVVGDQMFVTTAVDTGGGEGRIKAEGDVEWVLLSISKATGEVQWKKVLRKAAPHEGTHPDGTFASNSPVSDGERLYVYLGSQGLYAFSLDGEKLWERDFGEMNKRMSFGEGSSAAVYEGKVAVLWDHEGSSSIYVVDAETGKDVWKKERDERTSWSSPFIVEVDGKPQVITSATRRMRAYDLASGNIVWEAKGMTVNAIPSPVYKDGVVYLASGFRGASMMAIKVTGAKGDITGTDHVLWQLDKDTPYVPSPLLYNERLYFFKVNNPILTAVSAVDGSTLFGPERVEGLKGIYASPLGVANRVYLVGRQGGTVVLDASDEFKVLATNKLDDGFDASPLVIGDRLYLRGRKNLYCLGES